MKQRLIHLTLLLVFLVSTFSITLSTILPQPSASADSSDAAPPSSDSIKNGTFTWWDRNTIHASIDGKTYYFRATSVGGGLTGSSTLAYDVKNSNCWGRISFDSGFPFHYVDGTADGSPDDFKPGEVAPQTINVDMDWQPADVGGGPTNATCQNSSPNQFHHISIGDPQNFDIYFTVADDGRSISSVDGSVTYTQDSTYPDLFYKTDETTCQDVIQVDKSNGTYKSYELDQNGTGPAPPASTHSDPGCNLIGGSGLVQMGVDQKLGNAGALQDDPNPAGGGGAAGGGASSGSSVSCDLGIGLSVGGVLNAINPLNWLLCGIVKGMNLIVTSLDSQINSMLVLGTGGSTSSDNPNNIFADSSGNCGAKNGVCDNYYTAWRSFRNIALGLLVVVGLIIVISQALDMEILDTYTVRKMLPRVLVAVIAITLSWQLMRFFVTVSNDLGYGVGGLLDAPFHGLGQSINVGGSNGLLATFALALGGVFFDLFGMLAFVGTAAIAVLVTFLVLTLRQIAVILLIIFSPIAILAYVLPNTQRVYKFWWESFSKLLLMFPMIVAFITAGHIFSAISSGQGAGFVHQTIAFIAYFAPYFAIPLTFRFSGGLMSGIGNAVSSRGDSARGRLREFRSGRAKKNFADLGTGTRFEGKKWIPGSITAANKFGEVGRGVSTGWKGRFGLPIARGKSARGVALMTAAEGLQKTPGMQKLAGYNDANRIMAEGNGNELEGRDALIRHLTKDGGDDGKTFLQPAEAEARADAAMAAVKANGGFTKPHAMAALYSMAQDGTAIRDPKDAARLAAIVGGGDRNATFTTAAAVTSMSGRSGRYDLAAASDPIGKLSFAYADDRYHTGLANVKPGEIDNLEYEAWKSGAGSEGAYGVLNGSKSRGVRFPAEEALRIVKNEAGTFRPEQQKEAAAFLMHTQQGVQNGWGKPNNIAAFQEIMGKPENNLAFERFLEQPATIEEPKVVGTNPDGSNRVEMQPKETTMREDVSKLVGERAAMTQEQREQVAREERERREREEA